MMPTIFVIPAKAGIHLLRLRPAQRRRLRQGVPTGAATLAALSKPKSLEMDSRLRGNDEAVFVRALRA
ncbi:hypothetical protein NOVOSPHI9U_50434 [Novosphingobium sp. 9U]|nr:hypothetical protein NOVOSPHI9U_50434 [Novosphingobium sp. 9U]